MKLFSVVPCRYSRFVCSSGIAVALGLFLTSGLLFQLAPASRSAFRHMHYITIGKHCVEAAFAVLVCALIAAVIGETVFKGRTDR